MEPFTHLTAVAAPLVRDNVDTDAIIPSREMRSVSRKGLKDGLFAGWRYTAIGSRDPDPAFVLNRPVFSGARILVAGANFGCGSSREHAVWALAEYGFRAVIAPSFNPIFRGNCIANGVVPVVLPADVIGEIAGRIEAAEKPLLTVDLEKRRVAVPGEEKAAWTFEIEPEAREALLNGHDPIEQTLQGLFRIESFRAADKQARPWIYTPVHRPA